MDEAGTTPILPPPPRRRRALWLAAGLLVALPLALRAGVAALPYTAGGSAWLLSKVPGLVVQMPRGALARGGFGAQSLAYATADGRLRVALQNPSWQALHWQLRPAPGQWLGLRLDGLRADDMQVLTVPGPDPLQPPASLSLPLALDLPDLQIGRAAVNDLPPLQAVRGALTLGADGGALHRLQRLDFRLNGLTVHAQGDIGTGGPLPLRLQARVDSPPATGAHNLPAWRGQAQLSGPLASPDLQLTLRPADADAEGAELDAQARLQPFASWPLGTLDARLRRLDLHAVWPQAPRTRLEGQARLQSTGLQAPAALALALTNAEPGRWDAGRLPLQRLTVRAGGRLDDRSRLVLDAFTLEAGDGRRSLGRWQGEGEWTRGGLRLDTRLDALEPAGLDSRLPALRLAGPLRLRLSGVPPPGDSAAAAAERALSLDGTLDGALLNRPGSPPVRLALQADALRQDGRLTVTLARAQAQAGAAGAQAQGRWQQAADGRWSARGEGQLNGFDPAVWWPAAAAPGGHSLNGRWLADLQGRPPATAAPIVSVVPAIAALESLRWQVQPLAGHVSVDLADSRLAGVPVQGRFDWRRDTPGSPSRLEASLRAAGRSSATLQATLAAGAQGADQASLQLDLPEFAPLAPWARLSPGLAVHWPQAGRLVMGARTEGRWPALRSEGRFEADNLRATGWQLDRGRADWRLDGATIDGRLEATATLDGLASATPRGEVAQRLDTVQLSLSGNRDDHRLRLQARSAVRPPAWAGPLLGPGGSEGGTAFSLEGQGRWLAEADGARWQGRLERLRSGPVRPDATPWLAADDLQATLRFDPAFRPRSAELAPGRLRLVGSALRWETARWLAPPAGAPVGDGELSLQATLEPLPLAPLLARWQPDFGWGGDLVVAGRATVRSGPRFTAEVLVERRSGDLTVTDEGGTTALGLTDLRLAVSADNGTWHITQAVAGRTVGVLAGAQTLRTAPAAAWPAPRTPLEGVVELRVDNLGVWGPWTPAGWRLGGELHAVATLGGTLAAPTYTGRIDGQRLSARQLLQGIHLQDGQLALRLSGDSAQIERFVFRGGDGQLRIDGDGRFGEAPQARLSLAAERFLALGRLDRRLVVSGDARMTVDARSLSLDGRLRVDEGLIDFSRGDAPTLDGDVNVVRRAPAGAPVAEEPAPPRVPRQTDVRLALDLGERLRLRGRGLDTLLRGDLRLATPDGRPVLQGAVRAEDGTYTAYGQNLRIERGLITFTRNLENPRLDILALRPDVDLRVGVAVTGTALRPRVRLYAEPDMPDAEKLSWLVLGRAPEGVGRSDTALLQRAALALLSGEGEGGSRDPVSRALGVDDITLRQTGDNDVRSTVVGLGKQLSRRWYVGYERGVNSTTGTWQLIYRIAQRLTFRTQAGDDSAVDLLYIWRWNGRGLPPPGALLPSRPSRSP